MFLLSPKVTFWRIHVRKTYSVGSDPIPFMSFANWWYQWGWAMTEWMDWQHVELIYGVGICVESETITISFIKQL